MVMKDSVGVGEAFVFQTQPEQRQKYSSPPSSYSSRQ